MLLPLLQISDSVITFGVLGGIGTAVISIIISYLAYQRQPPLQSDTQKTVEKLTENFEQQKKDNDQRFADGERRFASIDVKLSQLSADSAAQAADIKLQIANSKIDNVNSLSDIKVQLTRVATSVVYIEGEFRNKETPKS